MVRPFLSASLTILFCGALCGQTPEPSPSPSEIGQLSPADLQRAIPLMREHYVNPEALNETELQRATLEGVIDRLGRRVRLLPAKTGPAATPAPFYREIIDGHIGYLRPGDLSRPQLQELDTTLRGFAGKKVDALILDLRGGVEANDFAVAAEFANRFVTKGKPLFSLRGPGGKSTREFVSDQAPLYRGLIVVLIDSETIGATEVLAAILRFEDHAILIGQPTPGDAVDYSDLPLPSGRILSVAVAEAILPDEHARYPDGVQPDMPVVLAAAAKQQIFQQSLTKGMAPFVFETDRPHLNEAALVAGTNPEIEAAQAAQQRRAQNGPRPAPLHDSVLQRAVDLVTSIEVYEKQTPHQP
ncbi:MAG TPA: S41 family peptidase [Chthoniobacterales bacterium]